MPEFKKGQCLACFKGNEGDRRVPTSGRKVAWVGLKKMMNLSNVIKLMNELLVLLILFYMHFV